MFLKVNVIFSTFQDTNNEKFFKNFKILFNVQINVIHSYTEKNKFLRNNVDMSCIMIDDSCISTYTILRSLKFGNTN